MRVASTARGIVLALLLAATASASGRVARKIRPTPPRRQYAPAPVSGAYIDGN